MDGPCPHPVVGPGWSSGGFSLLEVVIVLMLIAILLVVAEPRWPNALLLEAQAQRLAQDIRYTQALAMNPDRGQSYTIRGSGRSYTIVDASNNPMPPDPPPLEGVTMDPFSFSFSTDMGKPAAAYPPLRLAMGGDTVTLTVTALTGTVVIQP